MKKLAGAAALALACSLPLASAQTHAAPETLQTEIERVERARQLSRQAFELTEAQKLEEALPLLDEALRLVPLPGEPRGRIQMQRGWLLTQLKRPQEALPALEQASAMLPNEPQAYIYWAEAQWAAGQTVAASQNITYVARHYPERLRQMDKRAVIGLLDALKRGNHTEARFGLVLTLVWQGYDGGSATGEMDWLRMEAATGLLQRNRPEEAADVASAVTDNYAMLEMLVSRQFEPIWPRLEEKAGPDMAKHLAANLTAASEAFKQEPGNLKQRLRYMNALRALGRYEEAIAAAEPVTGDLQAMAAAGDDGLFLVNDQAYALLAAGRGEEADQLLGKLLALDIDKYPMLTNMAINRSEILLRLGRYEDALRTADWAEEHTGKWMNAYGRMWNWSNRTCALKMLGRQAEAEATLRQMAEHKTENYAAHLVALLCHDRLDDVEAVVLKQLADEEKRGDMLIQLQDFQGQRNTPLDTAINEKLNRVLQRPAVQQAVQAAGRLLTIAGPLI